MRRRYEETNIFQKLWRLINNSIFKLSLLTSFLGILPVIIFIYYNLINYNTQKVIVGCICLVTLIHSNKSMQG